MKKFIITEQDMREAALSFDSYEPNNEILEEIDREAKERELLDFYFDAIREFNRQ